MRKHILILSVVLFSFCGCKEEPLPPKLESDMKSVAVGVEGGRVDIPFVSNYEWTAYCDDAWLAVRNSKGVGGECTLVAQVSENGTFKDRSTTVVIKSMDLSISITVTQESYSLSSENGDKYDLDSFEQTFEVTVLSNVDYKYVIKGDWVKYFTTKTTTRTTYLFHADENPEDKDRTATIWFAGEAGCSFNVQVVQHRPNVISVVGGDVSLLPFAGSFDVKVNTNVVPEVSFISGGDWLSQVESRSGDILDYTFSSKDNDGPEEREATVLFSYGRVSDTLHVRQEGYPAGDFIMVEDPVLSSNAQEYVMKVYSNKDIDIDAAFPGWASLKDVKKDDPEKYFTIKVDAYQTPEAPLEMFSDRWFDMELKAVDGSVSRTVRLTQQPDPYSLISIVVPPSSNEADRKMTFMATGQSVYALMFDQWCQNVMNPVFTYMIKSGYEDVPVDIFLRGADGFNVSAFDGMYIDFSKF